MKKLTVISAILILSLVLSVFIFAGEKPAESTDPGDKAAVENKEDANPNGDVIIAYYFHGTQRCATCKKLEAYSREALKKGFPEDIADSSIVFTMVNYDLDENRHYIDDYGLYTKALILSKVSDGKEVEWKNLDKIWQLVRDEDKYIEYVQKETADFMNKLTENE